MSIQFSNFIRLFNRTLILLLAGGSQVGFDLLNNGLEDLGRHTPILLLELLLPRQHPQRLRC